MPIPFNGRLPSRLLEPTSIRPPVDDSVCQYPECGDPDAKGRLDEITFLLERCHRGDTWPWRVAAGRWPADEAAMEQVEQAERVEMPRLTL